MLSLRDRAGSNRLASSRLPRPPRTSGRLLQREPSRDSARAVPEATGRIESDRAQGDPGAAVRAARSAKDSPRATVRAVRAQGGPGATICTASRAQGGPGATICTASAQGGSSATICTASAQGGSSAAVRAARTTNGSSAVRTARTANGSSAVRTARTANGPCGAAWRGRASLGDQRIMTRARTPRARARAARQRAAQVQVLRSPCPARRSASRGRGSPNSVRRGSSGRALHVGCRQRSPGATRRSRRGRPRPGVAPASTLSVARRIVSTPQVLRSGGDHVGPGDRDGPRPPGAWPKRSLMRAGL